jgi:hypothetical protein
MRSGHTVEQTLTVMLGLVPGVHVCCASRQDVDGRDEPGHDVDA